MENIALTLGGKFQMPTNSNAFLLGVEFPLGDSSDQEKFELAFKSIVWVTYRRNFFPIQPAPTRYTSDAGWGCMLRSAQMILAEALQRHFGPDWRYRKKNHRKLLRWFLDAPKVFSFYSIHRMSESGRSYDKSAGEWYGPTTAALVLRDLVQAHRSVKNTKYNTPQRLEMLVSDDGSIYVDKVRELCEEKQARNSAQESTNDPLLHPGELPVWSQAIFLLVPVRLGLNNINVDYLSALTEIFKFPQCVGMIGGKPSHSLYFVGVQEDNLIYLDPHTVQKAATDEECSNFEYPFDEDIETYHCGHPKFMKAKEVDPSLAIGFYCKNVAEFTDLRARIGQLSRLGPTFINVQEVRPRYMQEYSLSEEVDNEEILETASEGYGDSKSQFDDDDDDFVLL